MIRYPKFGKNVAVTAPSSGVRSELHNLLNEASERMKARGYTLEIGNTCWTQHKAKSAQADGRADELNSFLKRKDINLIFPPWGGELLIEVLDKVEYDKLTDKWLLGYSDTSLLLFVITLKTGLATAHGTNLVDVRGEQMDDTTAMWEEVLAVQEGASITQYSSINYQQAWNFTNPSPFVFHLDTATNWQTISGEKEKVSGRLLGGCMDVIRHTVGTAYGNVAGFQQQHLRDEPILWYFENCEMSVTDMRRTLLQMKFAGWFRNCSGLMFGRSAVIKPVDEYTFLDVYQEMSAELNVPIIYDIDCGHVPPQMTFVNGAFAEVEVAGGKGKVVQHFRS